jgi:gliding motility-associated lipoprotein GldH
MMLRAAFFFLGALLLWSCGEQHFYAEQRSIDRAEWHYVDTLSYQVEIKDTIARYDIGMKIIHGTEFSFQNLYIKIITVFPDGETVSQTLPIDLADHTGIWYGDCGNRECSVEVRLQSNARFDRLGNHLFKVIQYMREDPIREVGEVMLFLDKKA